jgi:uncharacterized surface protein with fasciclin (FAS1) repeats
MFRRTRTTPVSWDEPEPPGRAAALAIAGVAGTISLVVGGLMWAGSAVSQPRTFDAGGAVGEPASRLGVVTVPADGTGSATSTAASGAPLSPVPLPPPPGAPSVPPAPVTTPAAAPVFVPQTATPATVATTAPAASNPTTTTTTTATPTTATTTPGTTVPSPAPPSSTTAPPSTPSTTAAPGTTSTTAAPTTTTPADTTVAPSGMTLWAAVQADPALGRFAELVEHGGVAASLEVDAAHTLFAPDDDAIAAYAASPAGEAELADPQSARAFVLRHLVLAELDAAALFALDRVESATGEWLTVDGTARTVGGAGLTTVDVRARNGVLHIASGIVFAGAAG